MKYRLGVAVVVFALAFGIYLATLAPSVGLTDSGELTVAAWALGNAHPPGFPLFLMVTHLITLIPVSSVAWRGNLASAFFAALACAMVSLAVAEAILIRSPDRKQVTTSAVVSLAALTFVMGGAGLLLAFSRTLWRYATVTEVYSLNTFLIATVFWLILSWRRHDDRRRLYAAAVVFGLALGVHHVTVGLTLIGLAVLVIGSRGFGFLRTRTMAIAAVVAIAAFGAVYAYLPIAAYRDPILNWGDPDNPARFMRHVTAKQYQEYVTEEEGKAGEITGYLLRDLGPLAFPLGVLLSIWGFLKAWRHDRPLFCFLLLVVLAVAAWAVLYQIRNDKDAYLLPATVALVIAAAYGTVSLSVTRAWVAGLLLVAAGLALVSHWPYRDRSRFFVAKDYVGNAFRTMERDALLLTGDWQLYSPMLYFLEVEKIRRDVKLVEYGMLIHSWYVESLQRRYPDLMRPLQKESRSYRNLLVQAENNTEQWQRDPNVQQLNRLLDDLVIAMVRQEIARGGHVYATVDVAISRQDIDHNLIRRLSAAYGMVPRGLVVEYLPRNQSRPLPAVPLELRGLNDGSLRYDSDDPVTIEVIPNYRRALILRGRYLVYAGRYAEAMSSYRQALALDPQNTMVQAELRTIEEPLGRLFSRE